MTARVKTWTPGETLTAPDLNGEFDNLVAAQNTVATTTAPGPSELATTGEINTGTDAARTITPDTLAGSNFGIRMVGLSSFAPATNCSTGDGKAFFQVMSLMNGMNLVGGAAGVAVAGVTGQMDIQIRRVRSGVSADMLTGKIIIATGDVIQSGPPTINGSNDDIVTGDRIFVDVDTIHTTPAQGLVVTLLFALP